LVCNINNINKVTTGNDFRLSKYRNHYDLRKFSFANKIVNIWNSLPNAVVDVDVDLSLDLTIFVCMLQDVKYDYTVGDYTVDLTGTEDRSEYDIENYWKVVVVFQVWYGHRVSSEAASINTISLT